jgi:hypothetical protein
MLCCRSAGRYSLDLKSQRFSDTKKRQLVSSRRFEDYFGTFPIDANVNIQRATDPEVNTLIVKGRTGWIAGG